MHISTSFDSGNVEVLDASDPDDVRLSVPFDVGGEHRQWFHFKVSGVRGVSCTLRLVNAGQCSYPKGWEGYQACASTDRRRWFRVPTDYVDGELIIRHTPTTDATWYAYFAPFSHERHLDLVARCASAEGVEHRVLGTTAAGRDLDLLALGEGPLRFWLIARQHPGESMAEWWMEGLLRRLLDPADALARALRAAGRFHVVPNMNPDGAAMGHLRCNAVGANLNREWHAPTLERSPEVKRVRDHMDETGVDLCLDVHGDEALPYNFVSAAEGIPGWTERLAGLTGAFCDAYERANPDFQQAHGYPLTRPGQANMSMCSNQVAQRYGCLAMTLEMPFKDNADAPDPEVGWSPARAMALGASVLEPMWVAVKAGLR